MDTRAIRIPGRGLLPWLAVALALFCSQGLAAEARIQLRDSASGAFLTGELRLRDGEGRETLWPVVGGRAQLPALPEGAAEARAAGYQTLALRFAGELRDWQLWLDPLDPPPFPAGPADAGGRIEGHVHDVVARRPVVGARVLLRRADGGEVIATSGAGGRFELLTGPIAGEAGESAWLEVSAPGLTRHQRGLRLVAGSHRWLIDLGGGEPGPDHRHDQAQAMLHGDDEGASRAPILQPPTSIRVGFADAGFTTPCCVGGCNAVAVMSLETYVKRGLNDEWIASWTGDSLRSGSIAYRSYGAWHVPNPRSPNYDICSSACCQVNDPDTSASTNAATDATAGMLLTRDSVAFRSEYSAENNSWDDPNDGLSCVNVDLSCGNGFVGSPSTGWPCLADAVAAGRGCFGHGRGMSQWGTQRWVTLHGQRWPWIVDHYYNDRNNATGAGSGLRTAVMTSPLRIDGFSVPASAAPGSTIVISLDLSNLAAQAHDPVWIGASLFRSGVGFVSDPPRDQAVRLEPGSQQRSRSFHLPPSLPLGSYDLLVALYFDIDGNGAINSGDLALTSARQDGILQVLDLGLFADGFE